MIDRTTRSDLIEAAERLFAQRGIAGVSLRQIAAAAGQGNPSAVHYHFGSKARLIEAALEYRQGPINQRRSTLLEKLEREGRDSDLRSLVEILVYPMVETLNESIYYQRFSSHVGEDAAYASLLAVERPVREPLWRVVAAISRTMRGFPAPVRTYRVFTALRLVNRALCEQERALESGQTLQMPTAALAAELVDMIIGILSSPISLIAQRALRSRVTKPGTRAGRPRQRLVQSVQPVSR